MKTNEKNAGIPDETPAPSGPPDSRSRTGKIARLPLAIRQQLNQRLQDGEQCRALVRWLNGLPEVKAILEAHFHGRPIVEPNLSAWKQGGYLDWEQEQKTLRAVATMFEEAGGLEQASKDGLTERMALVLTAQLALDLKRLQSMPEGEQKSEIRRELLGSLILVQRREHYGQRLRMEREKIALQRKLNQEERDEEFWQWANQPENRTRICQGFCYTAEEKQKRIRLILGTGDEEYDPVEPGVFTPFKPPQPNPEEP